MYESSFNKIFWGMVFIFVNINIGPLDIFPNFLGYLLIYSGLNALARFHLFFIKAKFLALVLAFISIKDIFKIGDYNILQDNFGQDALLIFVLAGINSIIKAFEIYLFYCICSGVYYKTEKFQFDDLKELTEGRFRAYLATSLFMLFYTPFMINLGDTWRLIAIATAIINYINILLIMGLIRKVRNRFGEQECI